MTGDRRKLKILLVAMNYAPERSGTAPYTMAWAQHMAGSAKVVVLAGPPHYPEWHIHDGYDAWRGVADEAGVRVVRLRHVVPRRPSMVARVLHETTFALRVLTQRIGRPDIVLAVSPPMFGAAAAALLAARLGVPFGLVVQDVYSRGVQELGTGAPGGGAIAALERWVLSKASGVLTIHDQFRETVTSLGADSARVTIVGNWAQLVEPSRPREEVRAEHGWAPAETIALHAGNMGVKQGLETLVESAAAAADSRLPLQYVLMGDGNQRPHLERLGAGIGALSFLPPTAPQDYANLLNAADVLVVCERPGVEAMSLPSKLTSYCAAGRPIVAATGPDGATAAAVKASGAGVIVPPGNPEALNAAIMDVVTDSAVAKTMGERGRQHALDAQGMEAAMRGYDDWLDGLIQGHRVAPS